jgi:hypothetical protein
MNLQPELQTRILYQSNTFVECKTIWRQCENNLHPSVLIAVNGEQHKLKIWYFLVGKYYLTNHKRGDDGITLKFDKINLLQRVANISPDI